MTLQDKPRHTFQSFWAGEALSPRELLCLKSFIDLGYDFDLYTFDAHLIVPAGVRVCKAADYIDPSEFFVYESGFGMGSPAAFANLFRYRLLSENGGWWVDTDVLCLSTTIPDFDEFFVRQDAEFINNAVLFFQPRHPVMIECYNQSKKLGRSVKWGDTGPRLITRVLTDFGLIEHALANSVCYPLHWSEALDVITPSKMSLVQERTKSSLFLHLWSEMLRRHGFRPAWLPPKGSFLRQRADAHQVSGWEDEYDWPATEHSSSGD